VGFLPWHVIIAAVVKTLSLHAASIPAVIQWFNGRALAIEKST
jgi:hypothetical protein